MEVALTIVNYWTYVDNTPDIPMERNVDGVINDGNGKRYVLGYKHGNLDVTTTQSAANLCRLYKYDDRLNMRD